MSKQVHEIIAFPSVGDELYISAAEEEKILYRCQFRIGDEEGEWNDISVEEGIQLQFESRKSHFFDLYIVFLDCENVSSTAAQIQLIRNGEVYDSWEFGGDELKCDENKVHLITIDAIVG
ncbi:MAG: hypothetical protein DHS20C09_05570 [marine bacterium B5-7]|nr:MAG: hypothetical protein DHS20C09_05570 [marine bacterium B5-7]